MGMTTETVHLAGVGVPCCSRNLSNRHCTMVLSSIYPVGHLTMQRWPVRACRRFCVPRRRAAAKDSPLNAIPVTAERELPWLLSSISVIPIT